MPRPDLAPLLDRSYYHHWHRMDVRVADLDDQQHVNNAIFAVFAEEGRRKFREPVQHLILAEDTMTFIARLTIDFHLEMSYPATVEIGTAIKRIGETSYTTAQALFTERGCHATLEVVSVTANGQTRRPMAIPAPLREFLLSHHVDNAQPC